MGKLKVENVIESFNQEYAEIFKYGADLRGIYRCPERAGGGEEGLQIDISIGLEDNDYFNPYKSHLYLMVPFIFDHRRLPKFYKGIRVKTAVDSTTLPQEFDFGDRKITYEEANNPQLYVNFIERCRQEIRNILEKPAMTEEEMLDAICWGDFNKYIREFKRDVLKCKGLINE
ncbi:MAG: hypothetical protein K8S16_16040 [Bacteroidales bacterium]|nr:hypothetical protein [Bacteroidales bacterium]